MIEETPLTDSQNDVRNGCSSLVHNMEVNKIQAGEMQDSKKPRKKRTAKKPEKLKTVA